jgi:drug/metabolite transporter (DMT)-like permease
MQGVQLVNDKVGLVFYAGVLILNVLTQFLEKKGMSYLPSVKSLKQLLDLDTLVKMVTNPYIVTGVVLSVVSLVLWLGALSTLKVSYLVPLTGVTYIVVALIGQICLGETITATRWYGITVIALGVFLINK